MENETQTIKDFLKQDNIDTNKFSANLEILKNETREIYKANIRLHSELDISEYATPSVDWLALRINQPIGYSRWFMAGYPDVVRWVSKLKDERIISIIDNYIKQEVMDENDEIKVSFLRKFVEAYQKEGYILECSKTIDM